MASLTPRGKALRHLSTHRGLTEQPPGSNTDKRKWGIRRAQTNTAGGGVWLVGQPWCGCWAFWALMKGGVKGLSWRLASVALIEDDARARRGPFFEWCDRGEWRRVMRGDLVVYFGRGVHVGVVRSFKQSGGQVYVVSDEGNTSSGNAGSQSNGGGSFRRVRPLHQVHGFARVDYPGGGVRRRVDRALMAVAASVARPEVEPYAAVPDAPSSDRALKQGLENVEAPEAARLWNEMEGWTYAE